MNIVNFQRVVPTIKQLIDFCRSLQISVFYTETVPLEKHNLIDKSKYQDVIAQKSIGIEDS
jgi:hypothetical protein